MEEIRDTVGKVSLELSQKAPESRDPIEIQREMQKDYLKELVLCVDSSKKNIPGDFFVVVITKNEKLMPNVFRNYFFARKTCPTPDYDQSVFMYKRDLEEIQYVWTIPSRDACIHLKENALMVAPEEKHLLEFIIQFSDGTLYKLARTLNAEVENPSIIAKG